MHVAAFVLPAFVEGLVAGAIAEAEDSERRVKAADKAARDEAKALARKEAAASPAKSADAPEERTADASFDWPVVVLTASREVSVHRPDAGLVLRLAPPRSLPAMPAGLAWMRVRDADGRRELREQQLGNPGSAARVARRFPPYVVP